MKINLFYELILLLMKERTYDKIAIALLFILILILI